MLIQLSTQLERVIVQHGSSRAVYKSGQVLKQHPTFIFCVVFPDSEKGAYTHSWFNMVGDWSLTPSLTLSAPALFTCHQWFLGSNEVGYDMGSRWIICLPCVSTQYVRMGLKCIRKITLVISWKTWPTRYVSFGRSRNTIENTMWQRCSDKLCMVGHVPILTHLYTSFPFANTLFLVWVHLSSFYTMLFFYQYFSQKNNRKRNSHHEKFSVFWKRIEPKLSFQPQVEQFGIKLYCVISI